MIIKKIHINAFGKLKNYDLDLQSGLNVVYGANEYGKSTIMEFIKMIREKMCMMVTSSDFTEHMF